MSLNAAILVIGNEILSGRTREANIQYLAKRLIDLGIPLGEARIIPDEIPLIVQAVRELSKTYLYVFTTGGIGATHDDKTAAALAKAFNVEVEEHPEALEILRQNYKERFNNAHRRMARMPAGARLIDNPVSRAPAFQIANVFALAGIPSVMQGMFETLVSRLEKGPPILQKSVKCHLGENLIADDLWDIQECYPLVEVGSYPSFTAESASGNTPYSVTLVVKGTDIKIINEATGKIADMIKKFGGDPELM